MAEKKCTPVDYNRISYNAANDESVQIGEWQRQGCVEFQSWAVHNNDTIICRYPKDTKGTCSDSVRCCKDNKKAWKNFYKQVFCWRTIPAAERINCENNLIFEINMGIERVFGMPNCYLGGDFVVYPGPESEPPGYEHDHGEDGEHEDGEQEHEVAASVTKPKPKIAML